ncbi:hypothetical protein AB0H42_08395 [Nocardia sp. NPDC050799]|uniref:hypothetical protein n=1 Tax=Nocardia sp. NPDC050799 TaxID=3154842 RepID=UPI0033E680E5
MTAFGISIPFGDCGPGIGPHARRTAGRGRTGLVRRPGESPDIYHHQVFGQRRVDASDLW